VTDDDRTETEKLVEVERLKQLKARYFRLLDTKHWEEWANLFTLDCQVRYGETERDRWISGREAVVSGVRRALDGVVSVHQGYMPEITITGRGSATGVWAMMDYIDNQGERPVRFKGYGHYHEAYTKGDDGFWRIDRLQLTRLRVDPL
jgi:hypothetical protein